MFNARLILLTQVRSRWHTGPKLYQLRDEAGEEHA